jgi:hypothetical protein
MTLKNRSISSSWGMTWTGFLPPNQQPDSYQRCYRNYAPDAGPASLETVVQELDKLDRVLGSNSAAIWR